MRSEGVSSLGWRRELALVCVVAMGLGTIMGSGGGGGSSDEKINGISVPPAPDPTANAATIVGVDSNGNGIRDDVDRFLATEFGQSASAYQEAVNFARTEQAAIILQTTASVEIHIALLRCVNDPKKLADFSRITLATVNGPRRSRAYAITFAGVVISSGGCL